MDAEDHKRISKHLAKLLDALKRRGVMTNVEVRAVAGSRGMGRVNDLIVKHHEPITVRKLKGALWEVRYGDFQPIAPDSTTDHLLDSQRSQLGLF